MLVSGSSDATLGVWTIFWLNELIDWTLDNRYIPELTEEQQQRYGLALESTATPAPTPVQIGGVAAREMFVCQPQLFFPDYLT